MNLWTFFLSLFDRLINKLTSVITRRVEVAQIAAPIKLDARLQLFRDCNKDLEEYHVRLTKLEILTYLETGVDGWSLRDDRWPALTLEQRLTKENATKEINSLCPEQLDALGLLWMHGLKGDDLRSFTNESFTNHHTQLLEHLILDKKQPMTPINALKKIKDLTHDEVCNMLFEAENNSIETASQWSNRRLDII